MGHTCAKKPTRMSPWRPIADPLMQRRLGKTAEELSELLAVIARIGIQGVDEVDPSSGKTNRTRLREEVADVLVQISLTVAHFDLDSDAMTARINEKERQMREWEQVLQEEA